MFDPFREINANFERLPKVYYIAQLRNAVANTPIPNIPVRIRNKIINSTQPRFRLKCSNVIKNYMCDVEKQYEETIRAFNVRRFMKRLTQNETAEERRDSFKFKQAGRTENHGKFLRHRRQLKEKLFIPYPFIRFIVHSSYQSFPSVLNNYGGYKKTKSGICIWKMIFHIVTVFVVWKIN